MGLWISAAKILPTGLTSSVPVRESDGAQGVPPLPPHPLVASKHAGVVQVGAQNLDGKELKCQNLENKGLIADICAAGDTASALTMLTFFGGYTVRCPTGLRSWHGNFLSSLRDSVPTSLPTPGFVLPDSREQRSPCEHRGHKQVPPLRSLRSAPVEMIGLLYRSLFRFPSDGVVLRTMGGRPSVAVQQA